MNYVSTRGSAPVLPFDEVLLAGLARDGGLYVPESWPRFKKAEIAEMRSLTYGELAHRVMAPFVGDAIPDDDLGELIAETYDGFTHPATAPLKQLDTDFWVTELFHGPTLAFKDYALQLVGRLFEYVLRRRGQHVTILGATSGDTGSAAIAACRDKSAIEIFILHPKDRVSEVQRRQMTTVDSANVHNIAIEGTFDDCQDLVKALFNDSAFRDRHALSAVNSINWARIMAQIVYYFRAALALGAPDRRFGFAVPTGNFGNVFAGYAAHRMGLPIDRLVIGSNANDILTRYLETGRMSTAAVTPTYSPSMDIQISSNFERLLFEVWGRDGDAVGRVLHEFRKAGSVDFGQTRWHKIRALFEGVRVDDDATLAAIRRFHEETGELFDPHSAIGAEAGRQRHDLSGEVMVTLATAHPAKFPDAVEKATGIRPALPPALSDLYDRPERCDVLANDQAALAGFIDARLSERTAA